MFYVYDNFRDILINCFPTRKAAVWYCKVNQKSSLPDGEWEDDYKIIEYHQEIV